jgi:hypothetical protein
MVFDRHKRTVLCKNSLRGFGGTLTLFSVNAEDRKYCFEVHGCGFGVMFEGNLEIVSISPQHWRVFLLVLCSMKDIG